MTSPCPASRLAEQLGALTAAGYRLVGLTEALDLLDAGSTDKLLAVTFDDGYRDFLTEGVPVLAEAGARATLYASVGHLGGRAGWLGRWSPDFGRLLTWDELAEVADAGIEIGNHSLIHHPLDVLPAAQLREEIAAQPRRARAAAAARGCAASRTRTATTAAGSATSSRAAGHDNATEVGRRLHRPGERRFAVPRLQPTPATPAPTWSRWSPAAARRWSRGSNGSPSPPGGWSAGSPARPAGT